MTETKKAAPGQQPQEHTHKSNAIIGTITKAAEIYAKNGYSVLPVNSVKHPAFSSWTPLQKEAMKPSQITNAFCSSNVTGVALIGGRVSGGLVCMDVDCKFDLTGTLWTDLQAAIKDLMPGLFERLVIQKTINNGYHLLYCTDADVSRSDLARRYATEEEKAQKVEDTMNNGAVILKANNTPKALIEVKAEGGYFLVHPSPGYRVIQGDLLHLPVISGEDHAALFEIARSFDQIEAPVRRHGESKSFKDGVDVFGDYNRRSDVADILSAAGWSILGTRAGRTFVKHPYSASNPVSGNIKDNILVVHSTSTPFDAEKGYSAAGVFTVLYHNGEYSAAAKALIKEGYGRTNGGSVSEIPAGAYIETRVPSVPVPAWQPPAPSGNPFEGCLVDLSQDVPDPEAVISINNRITGSPGNLTVIKAPSKAGKTFVVDMIAAAWISGQYGSFTALPSPGQTKIAILDSEQSKAQVYKCARRIHRMADLPTDNSDDRIQVYYCKELTKAQRVALMQKVGYTTDGLGLLILDVISDFDLDFNDLKATAATMDVLLPMVAKKNLHLVVTIHQNKMNDFARGHLGAALVEKAETVITLQKQPTEQFDGKCAYSRHQGFEDFAFKIDDTGLPVDVDPIVQVSVADIKAEGIRQTFKQLLSVERLTPVELQAAYCSKMQAAPRSFYNQLKKAKDKKWIVLDTDGRYRINRTEDEEI